MENKKKYFLYLLLVIWLGLIFFFSSQPGEVSLKQSDTIIYKITDIVSQKDDEAKEKISIKWTFLVRKTAHFFEYFVLGIIIYLVLAERKIKYSLIIAIILSIIFSSLDEIHQIFVIGRTAKVFDVFIDSMGATLSIFGTYLIRKNKHMIS